MSASPMPPTELSPEMEAVLGAEARPEPMSVVVRQEKLLEKLNLDGLAHWFPGNAVAVRELVLTYYDVFALEGNELGCTSAIKHEIHIKNGKPFKEGYAGGRGNSSKPITMVQCGGLGLEEGWYSVLLCQFQMPQCADEEGFVPFAPHSGGIGKHGGVSTFLIYGFQVRLLANQDGSRITTIHSLHNG